MDDIRDSLQRITDAATNVQPILTNVTSGINDGKLAFHTVIESLAPSLTNVSPSERAVGTRFVADVLHALSKNILNPDETGFLSMFFADRLKDHHSVVPNAIFAMLALVQQENINKDDVLHLVQSLFKEVHCQSHVMSDRRNIFQFLKYCIVNKLPAILEMHFDFILGFISFMDGEKDPRNLVLLFSLIPIVVRSFKLGHFTEELFEVIAAYFPIEFMPPTNDPFAISSDDLVLGLRQSLSCCPQFAPFCLPLLQEKLDSDLVAAKLDALHTLVACCDNYSSEDIRPHVLSLYPSLRREIVLGLVREVEEASLTALTAVSAALERGAITVGANGSLQQMTATVLADQLVHLSAPEQRLMFPSGHLLLSICAGSENAAVTICRQVIPMLSRQFQDKREELSQRNTMIILGKFLVWAYKIEGNAEDSSSLLSDSWSAILCGLESDVTSVREATVASLCGVVPWFGCQRIRKAGHILTSWLKGTESKVLRDVSLQCLVTGNGCDDSLISEVVLPCIMTGLLHNGDAKHVLDTLPQLIVNTASLSFVLPLLWDAATSASESIVCLPYLECTVKILQNCSDDSSYLDYIVVQFDLISKAVSQIVIIITNVDDQNSSKLKNLSGICRIILSKVIFPPPLVTQVITYLNVSTRDADTKNTLEKLHPQLPSLIYQMADGKSDQGDLLVYLLEGLLLGLCWHDQDLDYYCNVMFVLQRISLNSNNFHVMETSTILLATIINKFPEGSSFTEILSRLQADLNDIFNGAEVGSRKKALSLWTWLTKALVLKGCDGSRMWIEKLQDLLSDDEIGLSVAMSFDIVMKEHDYALQADTHCRVRLLHRQWFFEFVCPSLVEKFSRLEEPTRQNALVAISCLLTYLPRSVLATHILKLFPVLLHGVASTVSSVTEILLTTLTTLLSQSVNYATPHVGTLVPALLKLTTNERLGVRMKALQCLQYLAALPTYIVLPYRNDVTKELRAALGDKKRLARQTATKARGSWLLVGAPGGLSDS